jgi:DNA replication protein DnaC
MLQHPTYDKLQALKLFGMATALDEQSRMTNCGALTFEERLGLLVDREMSQRSNRQLAMRLRLAKLRQDATYEDVNFRATRGLDRQLFLSLCNCDWIRRHENCLLTGPTGTGKSYLACALANKACRDGWKVLYYRATRLFTDLAVARADGSFVRRLARLARVDLIVIDDWGTSTLTLDQSRDLLEILDDRYDRRSTIVASQVPVDDWHPLIPEPTIADASLDRLVHNAHRINLTGESLRKRPLPGSAASVRQSEATPPADLRGKALTTDPEA